MPYIGSAPASQAATFAGVYSQSFNGNGSITTFTLGRYVAQAANIEVIVNNVQQSPFDGSYSLSGGTSLVFSEAPSAGTNNIYVIYRDYPVQTLTDTGAVRKTGDTMSGVHRHNTYLSIGKGPNNNDQITFNAVPDNSGNYTPVWTGNSSAGGSIIGMNSGGNGGLVIRSLRFGTTSTPQAESAYPIRWQMTDDGMITMPYQPAFIAEIPRDNYTAVASGSSVIMPFYSAPLNVGSGFNTSTYKFTAPVAGLYLFYGTFAYQSAAASTHNQLQFMVNGSNYGAGAPYSSQGSWGTYQRHQRTELIQMAAGDYIDMRVYQDSGYNSNVREGMTRFMGYLLG